MRGAALIAALALMGCGRDPFADAQRAIDDGSARAAIQKQLDGYRQCAGLLNGFLPLDMPVDKGAAPPPGVAALVELGLIRPAGMGYAPTALARPQLKLRDIGADKKPVELCYGRRVVTGLKMKPRDAGDTVPQLLYRFRIVDAPAWARDPRITRSFAGMNEALAREHVARDLVMYRDGKWAIGESGIESYLHDIALDRQYFAPCPPVEGKKVHGCR
ncbi:hypothetical protein J2W22_000189 [Sphingomonas kyeonggiensis]|uniref:hypothetical protein n=1 Tax=Sphingomonas kyeonggiensis TaxID=1268553 RepID=UPI00278A61E4|nr:hypothetical protein [Sphingomonas kyeonggiensis]MDQ0248142.1 hypothetical protein [Sphingomonas kyeonggiensis]